MATQEKYVTEGDKLIQARKFLDHFGIDESTLSDEEVKEKIGKINQAKNTTVQVLSRGRATDAMTRLLKMVPKGLKGQFFGNNDTDIHLARAMGWEVFLDASAAKASPHGSGDNRVILGDQIIMVMPEENYVASEMVKGERRHDRRKRRSPKAQTKETSTFACPVFERGSPSEDAENISDSNPTDED